VTTPADERVTVGLVHGFHGLRGAVRVEVLSDQPERFAVGSVLYPDGDDQPLTIAWTGPAKSGLLVRFEELSSREAVEHLRERYLEAPAGGPLPEGTYYWHQLVGLAVTTTGGEALGSVVDVFRAGGNEVYVVRGGRLGEILVPGVSNVVVELDPEAGRLVVDPIALDLPAAPPRRRRRQEVTRRSRKAARATKAEARAKERAAQAQQPAAELPTNAAAEPNEPAASASTEAVESSEAPEPASEPADPS
jgi:16S rRNA processing protein RimM